ncbi:MAG: hypothetical protein U0271_36880 [Polyangiaceae bacterium]
MDSHLAWICAALTTLSACGAKVVFVGDGEGGSSGVGGVGGVELRSDFEVYCDRVDSADATCGDYFSRDTCVELEGCATAMLRPDAAPILLGCLSQPENVCYNDPFNECVSTALADIPLTVYGAKFREACLSSGFCDTSPYCSLPYWLDDGTLAGMEPCLGQLGGGTCQVSEACFKSTPASDCIGWIRNAGLF